MKTITNTVTAKHKHENGNENINMGTEADGGLQGPGGLLSGGALSRATDFGSGSVLHAWVGTRGTAFVVRWAAGWGTPRLGVCGCG